MVVCLRCLLHHILSLIAYIYIYIYPRQTGNLFSLLLCSLWWVQIIGYVWLPERIRLFEQHISLSSLCKLTWKHWTYKMPVRYILSSVWVKLSIFSQSSIICVFSVDPFPLWWLREYIYIYILSLIIIIIKSEIWNTTHCLGLGHGTMVCVVCLFVFFPWCN